MKLAEIIPDDCIITESQLYEMARVKPANTGIQNVIMYVSTKEVVHNRHAPRIKVSNIANTFSKNENFVVTISPTPYIAAGVCNYDKDTLNDIFDWVIRNQEPLLKYWNDEYSDDSIFYSELKKV